jgi:formaldehyde-activating enzyme involved in methanogenesis
VGKAPLPARTITVKLVPITVTGGVTNSVPIVLGTPVGSASVDLTTGSDGSVSRQFSVDFNDPGAGEYVLTASVDSAMTANSMVLVSARLEVRNVLP